jgi:hypothetical protein
LPGRIEHLYQDPHVPDPRFVLHYGDMTDAINLIRIVQETHAQAGFLAPWSGSLMTRCASLLAESARTARRRLFSFELGDLQYLSASRAGNDRSFTFF